MTQQILQAKECTIRLINRRSEDENQEELAKHLGCSVEEADVNSTTSFSTNFKNGWNEQS